MLVVDLQAGGDEAFGCGLRTFEIVSDWWLHRSHVADHNRTQQCAQLIMIAASAWLHAAVFDTFETLHTPR